MLINFTHFYFQKLNRSSYEMELVDDTFNFNPSLFYFLLHILEKNIHPYRICADLVKNMPRITNLFIYLG